MDEEQKQEREIEYLVKDDVGALASTLQVISVSISDSCTCRFWYDIINFCFCWKDLGINLSGVNLDHLPEGTKRTTDKGHKINYIECSMDKSTKERLYSRLRRDYGAINVEDHEGIT